MEQNQWLTLFVGIALTSGLIALGVVLYSRFKGDGSGSVFEAAVEAALLPLIYQGICSAYRVNEMSLEQLKQKIQGADKKAIADSIYAMLPEKIGNFDLIIIKRIVPQQRFEQLVQNAFDRFDRFYVEHQKHFDDLFEKWKAENAAASLTTAADLRPVS
jgi:hypothetical protein